MTTLGFQSRRFALGLVLLIGASSGCALWGGGPKRTALDDYIARPEPAYKWELVNTIKEPGLTTYVLDLTSQNWRTPQDVHRTEWKHWLVICKPEEATGGTALLYISGGNNGQPAPKEAPGLTKQLAMGTKAIVAELRMVPNQPLQFVITDKKPRSEDDLIAYTWVKEMETGDPTWTARMPMVKSAVKAMDAMQEFCASDPGGKTPIEKFVVSGGSKRGWTTWLTGVVDPRVVAIVPIVIDVLNVRASMEHHYAAYGFWAPSVGDYVAHGLPQRSYEKAYEELLAIEDPYSYRHRLKIPKFVVNASGDQFFVTDSWQFYWDDLIGEKYLRYVPNADHGMGGTDAAQSVMAYFNAIAAGKDRPQFTWGVEDDGTIHVETKDEPLEVNVWSATNAEARDFRVETLGKVWKSEKLAPKSPGVYSVRMHAPEKGWSAYFIELVYESGIQGTPFKFTTGTKVVPDTLPHAAEAPKALGKK